MALREVIHASGGIATGKDASGQSVMASMSTIPAVGWTVIVMLPTAEAFGPISRALVRTGALLVVGALFAAVLAYWLARRMTGPIQRLEYGTEQIGAGNFEHRIAITSVDELGRLAARFNAMAGELAISQERQERIRRLKRFLSPQIAELVDRTGDDNILDGQRVTVSVIFCDLRGFTAFSAASSPDAVMDVLGSYFEALGRVVTAHRATLISFTGDGLMAILNAPVRVTDPALAAARLAIDMQAAVQSLLVSWRGKGHQIGFGVGAAMGAATVGRIGYEQRYDYTAIGPVVNLAARLCASAADGQILVDVSLADSLGGRVTIASLGSRPLKGLKDDVPVFSVSDGVPREPR
ncbi:class 3 adenylate cyclase [Methylobacterium brachythecii]|uniref:Class 3 adenylate cyclase n=1 Tax=Methylobacterium brachythecii TaxID=1176177 RepID=A0A7W6AI54_9HYPH|nr:class 3 adenylate cyclase [Methylobacterium brachythecii]